MTDRDLATLWCALNCASGHDRHKMIVLVMAAIERRIGLDSADVRWLELQGRQDIIIKATKEIGQ